MRAPSSGEGTRVPSTVRQRRPEISLLSAAAFVLAVGVLVYVLDRGGAVYFLPAWLAHGGGPSIVGPLANQLPTFTHPLAFILITAAVLHPWPRLLPAICLAWFSIECLFELGQLEPIGQRIADAVPAWFDGVPLLEATPTYFSQGTFDPLDLLSIGLGVVAAYLIACFIERRGECNETLEE